jgi:acyl-coenzyme A thioesterase PaaI-like protein
MTVSELKLIPPAEFNEVPFTGIFNKNLGQWYIKGSVPLPIWGVFITPNLIRDTLVPIAHGGVLMAFADFTMYYGARLGIDRITDPTIGMRASEDSLTTVTVSINCDFMNVVKVGDFLESHAEIGRASKGVTFMRTTLKVGNKPIMQCSGTYMQKGNMVVPKTV